MRQDDNGFAVTTASAEAAAHLQRAVHSFNHWDADLMTHIDAALAADKDFVMAHALKGLAMAGGRNRRFQPVIEQSLVAARAGMADVSPRERGYVAALTHMAAGRLTDAAAAYEAILLDHPTDILAHRLVQQELFWMGEAGWMRDVAERAAPAWSADVPDYSLFLSVRAFGNEEALHYADAERFGRGGVEIDPSDAWGAHAVAHVLIMQDRIDDGIRWLEGLAGNWAGKNQIVHHLWWHLALFLLERGDHDRVLALYDSDIRNPDSPLVQAVPDAYIDIQNAAAMLMRLELRGVDVGGRWQALDDVAEARIGDPASPFTNAHAAMILAANGRFEKADELVASMQDAAATDPGPLGTAMRASAIPASIGSIAYRRGDHDAVLAALLPARRQLWHMGGSHAQRDIFVQLLIDSARRLGRADLLSMLLPEITDIGFADVADRTLYRDAARLLN